MGKPCALCGRTDLTLTNEHVFGEWIGQHVRTAQGQRVSLTRIDPRTGTKIEEFVRNDPVALHQVKVRALCRPCNVEWGGSLEADVGPILAALANRVPGRLTASGATILATWALKVAIMRERVNPIVVRHIPVAHARELRETRHPPTEGVAVWAATSDEPPNGQWWVRSRLAYGARRRGRVIGGIKPDSYLFILTFASLAMFVVGTTATDETARDMTAEFPEMFVRLWPNPVDVEWPIPLTITGEEMDLLYKNVGRFWVQNS